MSENVKNALADELVGVLRRSGIPDDHLIVELATENLVIRLVTNDLQQEWEYTAHLEDPFDAVEWHAEKLQGDE